MRSITYRSPRALNKKSESADGSGTVTTTGGTSGGGPAGPTGLVGLPGINGPLGGKSGVDSNGREIGRFGGYEDVHLMNIFQFRG